MSIFMFDTVLLVILFVALIALDLLALEFGADSRKPIDPWATFLP